MKVWATYHDGDDSVVLWQEKPTVHAPFGWRSPGDEQGWIGVEAFRALFGRLPSSKRPMKLPVRRKAVVK